MGEFEYRGFRVRTYFDTDWQIRTWPPLRPIEFLDAIRSSPTEGERACRRRAAEAIDAFIAAKDSEARVNPG